MYHRNASIIILRAAAYNYIEFKLQKYRKAGKSIQDFIADYGVGDEITLEQVYLELVRAVADGNYKMKALDKIILPADKIVSIVQSIIFNSIEEVKERIQNGDPFFRDAGI